MSASGVAPRRQGLGLGLRLGLLTALVVVGVMAAVTGTQLTLDLRADLRERRTELSESLSPLVAELQNASTREAAHLAVVRFHSSYVNHGRTYHDLAVVDSAGRDLIGPLGAGARDPRALLTATVSLVAPALGTERVALIATEDGASFSETRARRWWAWALHLGLTALLILGLLFMVIRREVTGPINRLLGGVRKMELGYWDDMPDPGGAWEVRWLGWRFRALGRELSRTVEHLVSAQRRASAVDADLPADAPAATMEAPGLTPPAAARVEADPDDAIRRLRARLECLRHAAPGDAAARSLAQITWDSHTVQAERLGLPELRTSLEDAALHVLDPDGFVEITRRIDAERSGLDALAEARSAQLHDALAARGVPIVELCHRVKHAAGIWKKMHQKNLSFEQIHDLVALRIVVPTEADCYHALGVVHGIHAPVVARFKDYIARPKPNGYRGLHTSVRDPAGSIFEVQIRSSAMHRHAEQGPAAHAEYKEATWLAAKPGRVALWRHLFGGSGVTSNRSKLDGDATR